MTIKDAAALTPDTNFNPHSHEGSDIYDFMAELQIKNFNPHSHEWSDPVSILQAPTLLNFNPHSHEGSDGGLFLSRNL